MPVTKVVIPAAGFGTRMLPASKRVPKEILPVLSKPTIQYVVEEAVEAGACEVCLVVSDDKQAVEDHFKPYQELEQRLAEKGQLDRLGELPQLMEKVKIGTVLQREQLGLGHAVLQAKEHVGDQPFLCMLGDTIFSGGSAARQLAHAHAKLGGSIIGLQRVPRDDLSRYGVAAGEMIDESTMRITGLVEKPPVNNAPSDLAIAARYLLSPRIFNLLETTAPGQGGEIQLTDALQRLATQEPVYGVVLDAHRHDIGNPAEWLRTNLSFARRDAHLWRNVEPLLRKLLSD